MKLRTCPTQSSFLKENYQRQYLAVRKVCVLDILITIHWNRFCILSKKVTTYRLKKEIQQAIRESGVKGNKVLYIWCWLTII